jgi:hypothetical protein
MAMTNSPVAWKLPVRLGLDKAVATPGREELSEELPDQVAADVLQRHRRHGQEDVVGEQIEHTPEVGALRRRARTPRRSVVPRR